MWDSSSADDCPPGVWMSSPDDSPSTKHVILTALLLSGKTPHVLNPASIFAGTTAQ